MLDPVARPSSIKITVFPRTSSGGRSPGKRCGVQLNLFSPGDRIDHCLGDVQGIDDVFIQHQHLRQWPLATSRPEGSAHQKISNMFSAGDLVGWDAASRQRQDDDIRPVCVLR
jgi:hypothetical protein